MKKITYETVNAWLAQKIAKWPNDDMLGIDPNNPSLRIGVLTHEFIESLQDAKRRAQTLRELKTIAGEKQ